MQWVCVHRFTCSTVQTAQRYWRFAETASTSQPSVTEACISAARGKHLAVSYRPSSLQGLAISEKTKISALPISACITELMGLFWLFSKHATLLELSICSPPFLGTSQVMNLKTCVFYGCSQYSLRFSKKAPHAASEAAKNSVRQLQAELTSASVRKGKATDQYLTHWKGVPVGSMAMLVCPCLGEERAGTKVLSASATHDERGGHGDLGVDARLWSARVSDPLFISFEGGSLEQDNGTLRSRVVIFLLWAEFRFDLGVR
jgi:hypothetical protein